LIVTLSSNFLYKRALWRVSAVALISKCGYFEMEPKLRHRRVSAVAFGKVSQTNNTHKRKETDLANQLFKKKQ